MFIAQFWYGIYCRYSAQSFFDDWTMAAYNVLLLALPPLAMAIFEKDLHEQVIAKYPKVYKEMQTGIYLTNGTFAVWMCSAMYQSLVFFFSIFLLPEAVRDSGLTGGLWGVSTMVAASGIVTIILRGALATRHWVWINHLFYWGSIALLFIFLFIESHWLSLFPQFYGVMDFVTASGYFWFYFFWVIVICLLPDVVFNFVQRQAFPYMWQIVQEEAHHQPDDQVELSEISSVYLPQPQSPLGDEEVTSRSPLTQKDGKSDDHHNDKSNTHGPGTGGIDGKDSDEDDDDDDEDKDVNNNEDEDNNEDKDVNNNEDEDNNENNNDENSEKDKHDHNEDTEPSTETTKEDNKTDEEEHKQDLTDQQSNNTEHESTSSNGS